MWFLTEASFLVTLSLVCAVAFAQTGGQKEGEPARGSTPPGISQDGAKPADGALKGGSTIAPGESAGMPERKPGESAERLARCDELSGKLREECLDKERSGAAGGSAPRDPNEVLRRPF